MAFYTHRNGFVWTAENRNPRSVREAEGAISELVNMALTERDNELARNWMRQLGDLLEATREAKAYEKANPVQAPAGPHPIFADILNLHREIAA